MANNQLLAVDKFTSGSLAAGWTVWPNASGLEPSITGGAPYYAQASSVGHAGGVIFTGVTWGNDQVSECIVQALNNADSTSSTNIQLFVRVNSAGTTGYEAFFAAGLGTGGKTLAQITNYATGAAFASATVTLAAGDVLTLQAAGCAITLYQNGIPVLFIADATFPTGGSPGFALNVKAGSSLSHAQIAGWNGYSCVQQDGIWQKQGVVLAPNATDLSSSGQGLFGGSFIFDTNPQLIGGTSCYKTWFSGGTPSSQGTYYAESPDLINWTRKSAQVISGYTGAMVIKVASTYYSYSQAQNAAGSGNVVMHTSTDGISWTLINSNVLSPGSGGAWDSGGFYPLRPITVIGGTWYALTTGLGVGNTGKFAIGLATSTDGQTWTKYASNPVLSATNYAIFPLNTAWTNVGGVFYFWHSVGPSQPQQASGQDIYQLPSETARYSTTDFIHWSGPTHSLHHSDQYEDVNNPTGSTPNNPGSGLNPCGMFTVAGKAYAIGQSEVLDGANAGTQFSLAIANATLAQIVTAPEDAVQPTATDNFTSGTGSLDSNWTTPSGLSALQIVSGNLCEPSANSVNCAAMFTGGSFSSSQYAEVTLATLGSNATDIASPVVWGSVSTGNHYHVIFSGALGSQSYSAEVVRYVGGSGTVVGPTVGITPAVGDVIRLSVIPSSVGPVLSMFQNGSMILQYVDQSSSALTGGIPGIFQSENASTGSQVSLFAAGNANVMPSYGGLIISGRVHGTQTYKNGVVLATPHTFGNAVNWAPSPAHFGNVDAAGIGNPVQWSPSPAHFGTNLPGGAATVTLSGAAAGTTTTDEFGDYSFTGLGAGTYTVTPSLAEYVFAPESQTFTISDSRNGVSFGAMQ